MKKIILTADPNDLKTYLTAQEAMDLLSIHSEDGKERVHTMEGGVGFIMGCDMDLTTIKKALKASDNDGIRLSGPNMRGACHGVAIWYRNGWLFLETNKAKVDAIHELRKIK